MSNTWFTSDTHFGHFKICQYCNRPFQSIEEMDLTLIRKWNERVKKEDLVFFLGDFCFKKSSEAGESRKDAFDFYRSQLNGNIIFIKGNHDKNNGNKSKINNIVISINNQYINLIHNPNYASTLYKINLVGHIHEKWEIERFKKQEDFTDCINIGVDVWNFYPVNWSQLMSRYSKWLKTYEE